MSFMLQLGKSLWNTAAGVAAVPLGAVDFLCDVDCYTSTAYRLSRKSHDFGSPDNFHLNPFNYSPSLIDSYCRVYRRLTL